MAMERTGPGDAPAVGPDADQSLGNQRGHVYDHREPTQRDRPRCRDRWDRLELAAGRQRTKVGRHDRARCTERRARRELLDGWGRG